MFRNVQLHGAMEEAIELECNEQTEVKKSGEQMIICKNRNSKKKFPRVAAVNNVAKVKKKKGGRKKKGGKVAPKVGQVDRFTPERGEKEEEEDLRKHKAPKTANYTLVSLGN